MQRRHMNGSTKVNYSHHNIDIISKRTSSKSKNGTLNAIPRKNKVKVYDDDDLDIAPYVSRKNRLIQELETSLTEMDGQLESASKLEEQKTAVEDQRTVLLKEIEAAVCEIQGHVLNSREMEIEKKAIEHECIGLKKQVKHLRTLLDKQTPNDKQWNYVDLMDSEETMRLSLAHANSRNHMLEKEVQKLRLANERFHLNAKANKGSTDYEKLKREYADLNKLLQVAETSEDNIAQELATCHQTMAQMKDDYEQLEKVKSVIEDERDGLSLEKAELEMEIKKLREDKQNCNVIEKESSNPSSLEKEALQRKLQKNEDNCEQLEQENSSYKKRIEELQNELKKLNEQSSVKVESENKVENSNSTQLKSALVKLNKENSQLQVSLEKAEQEISELKSSLEKEQADKEANADKTQQLRPALDKLNKENLELQTELEKAEKEISALKICLEEQRGSKKPEDATPDATPEKEKTEKTKKRKGLKLRSKKEKKQAEPSIDVSDNGKDDLEVQDLKKVKFNLESECQALSETVTKIAGEKRTMKNQVEEITNEKTKLEAKITELEALIKELEVIKGQKEELDQKYQGTEACLAQVSAELEKTHENNTTLSNQLVNTLEEKETLLQEQKDFQESLDAIKKEMENVRKVVSHKSTEIKLLRKKHEEEKRRLIGMKDGGDKELNRLKTNLQEISGKVMKSTEEYLEHDSKDVVTTIERLHEDNEELNQQNTELHQSKQEIEKKYNEVNKKAEELQKESAIASDMAMEKAVELSRTKRSLERKIEKLNKENAEYRNKLGVATPAMSITPRMSPETIQVQNAEVVESQFPFPVSPRQPGAPPPPQRSEPLRLSGARHEGPVKIGPPGTYSGAPGTRPTSPPQDYQNRGPERREGPNMRYGFGPLGTRNDGANTRNVQPLRSPPPYPLSKRVSLDDVLMRDRERGIQRQAPPYPGRERRISDNRRPQSGSVVVVTAGCIGEKDDGKKDDESSLQRDRWRSDGGRTYRKRMSNEVERYRHDSSSSEQNSAFRVAGYRKKVMQEDYV